MPSAMSFLFQGFELFSQANIIVGLEKADLAQYVKGVWGGSLVPKKIITIRPNECSVA